MKVQPRVPRGMRDLLPQQMIRRRYVIDVIEACFEEYGFEPLQTPALELAETLMGKYGPEAEKLIYDARHREGKEDLALRYDLSVPLSRVVAMNPDLVKPFKRYQIAPVWRAERPQKGRYREFYQCDADIVGSASMLADAEIVALIVTVLTRLGFKQFTTKINNRKILTGIGLYAQVPREALGSLYRAIDKLEKIGLEGVKNELRAQAIPDASIDKMMALLEIPVENLMEVRDRLENIPQAVEGIEELVELYGFLADYGLGANVKFDFAMVRGLEYYTGPIFETIVTEPKIGSLTGGGRYDGLIGLFSDKSLPATGTTLGIERIIDVMDELDMYPARIGSTVTQVFVTVFDAERRAVSIKTVNELRSRGIRAELALNTEGLGKQLKYAATKGIPYVVIIGPDEAIAGKATVRDMKTGQQSGVSLTGLADQFK